MSKERNRTDEYYIFERDIEEMESNLQELSIIRAESDEKDEALDLAIETLSHALILIDTLTTDTEALFKELTKEEEE